MLKKFHLSPFEALRSPPPGQCINCGELTETEVGVGWEEALPGSHVRVWASVEMSSHLAQGLKSSGFPQCLPCLPQGIVVFPGSTRHTFLSLWLDGETHCSLVKKNFRDVSHSFKSLSPSLDAGFETSKVWFESCSVIPCLPTHHSHISFCRWQGWQDLGDLPGPRGDGRMGDG